MCSELTPRAPIPDTRIPQLMQPWSAGIWVIHRGGNSGGEWWHFLTVTVMMVWSYHHDSNCQKVSPLTPRIATSMYDPYTSTPGLHKLWYPGIRDRSTWGKFGAHGEHGDVFLFSNLGALWFSENLIRYSLHVCLREVKNNLFSFKHSYLRHFSWRF